MTKIIKLLALGTIGYAVAKRLGIGRDNADAAHAPKAPSPVRDSGPENMRDQPKGEWTKVDEASDQSFPASDPPATY